MPRRRASDDEAWADRHEGECGFGHINELREAHVTGKPFEPKRGPLGFCIDPAAYRPSTKRTRARTASAKKRKGKTP